MFLVKTEKRKIGDIGEDIAATFLVKNGYHILWRNYLKPWGEIDIVAKSKKGLHFIEVKTVTREKHSVRGGSTFFQSYLPEDHVNRLKLTRLRRTVGAYLSEKRVSSETLYQIDVLAITIDEKQCPIDINFIENVQ